MLEESPRWLVSNGRYEDAKAVFKKVAKTNKVKSVDIDEIFSETFRLNENHKMPEQKEKGQKKQGILRNLTDTNNPQDNNLDNCFTNDLKKETDVADGKKNEVEKYTVLDILKNANLRKNTFILWYTW